MSRELRNWALNELAVFVSRLYRKQRIIKTTVTTKNSNLFCFQIISNSSFTSSIAFELTRFTVMRKVSIYSLYHCNIYILTDKSWNYNYEIEIIHRNCLHEFFNSWTLFWSKCSFNYPFLSLFPSFSLPDVLYDTTDLIWR